MLSASLKIIGTMLLIQIVLANNPMLAPIIVDEVTIVSLSINIGIRLRSIGLLSIFKSTTT